MIYSKKEREVIKNRIVELLEENGSMKYSEISDLILSEGLARTHQIVGQILKNGCKDDEKFKGEDLFINLKMGLWGLSKNSYNKKIVDKQYNNKYNDNIT